jgi:hypothetical protein
MLHTLNRDVAVSHCSCFKFFFHDPNVAYGETKGVKLVGDRVNA